MIRRRALFSMVAVLCAVAQIGLGASAALGLVLCVGVDHAAIELPSDDCCDSHGGTQRHRDTALEPSCCSDVPLVSAARSISDVRRTTPLAAPPAAVTAVWPSPPFAMVAPVGAAAAWSPPPPRTLRPVVLRV